MRMTKPLKFRLLPPIKHKPTTQRRMRSGGGGTRSRSGSNAYPSTTTPWSSSASSSASAVSIPSPFQSWVSVLLLIVLLQSLRSIASPFLSPRSEAWIRGRSITQFNHLTAFLYCWLSSVTVLTVVPHFTTHHNAIIAASFFFPVLFATVAVLLAGRFAVRVLYVARTRTVPAVAGAVAKVSAVANKVELAVGAGGGGDAGGAGGGGGGGGGGTAGPGFVGGLPTLTLVAFQRPFRRLVVSSSYLSAALCLLYAHCWSRDLDAFKLHDAGAICRVAFAPFASRVEGSGGANNEEDEADDADDDDGAVIWAAHEFSILFLWASIILVVLYNYARDEFAGRHVRRCGVGFGGGAVAATPGGTGRGLSEASSQGEDAVSRGMSDDYEDEAFGFDAGMTNDRANVAATHDVSNGKSDDDDEEDDEDSFDAEEEGHGPIDPPGMVPWYSFLLFLSSFDILVQLLVFLGRYDARTMQPALARCDSCRRTGGRTTRRGRGRPLGGVTNGVALGADGGGRSTSFDDGEEAGDIDGASEDYDLNNSDVSSGCVFDCGEMYGGGGDGNCEDDDDGMWFDFMSDCGDGFNPSYQVARMLAQPKLSVICGGGGGGGRAQRRTQRRRVLPRGKFLVVGGDLAYPGPTMESYETRFFRSFEDAMPPPPSFRRGAVSANKPALPVRGWRSRSQGFTAPSTSTELSNRTGSGTAAPHRNDEGNDTARDRLKRYGGPCAFVIPGNHDWYDGLTIYTRLILSRDWLGGWLLPQKRSYFALALSRGWWLLAFDLSLSEDIDVDQFKFFADVAATSIGPTDAVVVVTHEPHWVIEYENRRTPNAAVEANLRELMDVHLAGRVRLRLAGDLHHYTRHVPVVRRAAAGASAGRPAGPTSPGFPTTSSGLTRSQSTPRTRHMRRIRAPDPSTPVASPCGGNDPELVVSGGGGAFLHLTHCFSNCISVGPNARRYVRVCAYPDEQVSRRLSWLNIWQFRWRNWRLDIVWAVTYFCVASSLFPLCGIYNDYLAGRADVTQQHDPFTFVWWVVKTQWALFCEVFSTGRISAIFAVALVGVLFGVTDYTMDPRWRVFWGCSHGIVHVWTALLCLLFVECITEWSIYEGIVKVTTSAKHMPEVTSADGAVDLASSLYQEYTAHFSRWIYGMNPFANFTAENSFCVSDEVSDLETLTPFERMHAHAFDGITTVVQFFGKVPLLRSAMSLFDLPGHIAQNHLNICEVLCANGQDCMLHTSAAQYQLLERSTLLSYLLAISLYFVVLAIPLAGNVFGTWLALTLNLLRSQYNEGSSSLRIQHWKNFLRLHIKKNGDLEIFAIGLHRVPKRWTLDPLWDGSRAARRRRRNESRRNQQKFYDHATTNCNGLDRDDDEAPSWSWRRPSKWIPVWESQKFVPHLVDYTCISKFPPTIVRMRTGSFDGYESLNSRSRTMSDDNMLRSRGSE